MAAPATEETDSGFPVVETTETYVAVRWTDNGPWFVVDQHGAVSERFTLPPYSGPAHLPIPLPKDAA